ncbi:MAG: TerB family tellurite resistance protein, partial [Alphaproteobacteria bacterium]
MFSTVKNWLSQNDTQAVKEVSESLELAQLVTALLIEAAGADGKIAEEESQLIAEIISAQFELSDDEMMSVLSDAVSDYADRVEIHGLVRRLREKADYEERIGVLELVWMVVLSDNRLDQIEAQLMRRLAGLLYIS